MAGIDADTLAQEHKKDTDLEGKEGVHFMHAWPIRRAARCSACRKGPTRNPSSASTLQPATWPTESRGPARGRVVRFTGAPTTSSDVRHPDKTCGQRRPRWWRRGSVGATTARCHDRLTYDAQMRRTRKAIPTSSDAGTRTKPADIGGPAGGGGGRWELPRHAVTTVLTSTAEQMRRRRRLRHPRMSGNRTRPATRRPRWWRRGSVGGLPRHTVTTL